MIQKKYKDYIKEHAISRKKIEMGKNILKDIHNVKDVSKYINNLILELKRKILNIDNLYYRKIDEINNKDYLVFIFRGEIGRLIDDLIRILNDVKDKDNIYDKYFNLIYPDGNDISFDIEVDVEKNNLNRIHVPIGLPYNIKSLGLGVKLYKKLLNDYGYISTIGDDITMDSTFVWDNLINDNNIYSFIRNNRILCISPELNYYDIISILKDFYKDIDGEYIILDDDFKNKYIDNIRKDIKNIFEYEINQ